MILSHYRAGTGALLVSTREEARFLAATIAELPPEIPVCTVAAPGGPVRKIQGEDDTPTQNGLIAGYQWASAGPGRVLVVYDWHTLANTPGHWRALAENLPLLRSPRGVEEGGAASLVIFVAPSWELSPANPMRGCLPVLEFAPPDRESIRRTAEALHPLNGDADAVIDSLCGLTAQGAEQAAAEVLARTGGRYDVEMLREARKESLREAGLEIWTHAPELGGLAGIQEFTDSELIPWIRDEQLAVRRILSAGLPGTGKSFFARFLAGKINCECARLSIPALKAGIVGASEGNLRRALQTVDAMAKHAPIVLVLDEIDTIARDGLDGGTSSGMFSELLTWLQEGTSQAIVVATLNRLDKLDAALESRFQARFFFDLPSKREREAVAKIHYGRLKCADVEDAARMTAEATEGYSSREIAEHVCPSVARLSMRTPDAAIIRDVTRGYTPASTSQSEQLKAMRTAAQQLRRANDQPDAQAITTGRKIAK